MTATAVLVHGAWHGSWCWTRVEAALRQRGVPVVAVDLPRQRYDSATPDATARVRGQAMVRAVLDSCTDGAVFVGHSAGGRVLTAMGDHPNVRHLVYLAAVMPPPDADAAELERAITSGLLAESVELAADGSLRVRAENAGALFYGDCTEDDRAWAISQLAPEWLAPPAPPLDQAPWTRVPSTYVICDDDAALLPEAQASMATQAKDVVRLPASHSPFLSMPGAVADLLAVLA